MIKPLNIAVFRLGPVRILCCSGRIGTPWGTAWNLRDQIVPKLDDIIWYKIIQNLILYLVINHGLETAVWNSQTWYRPQTIVRSMAIRSHHVITHLGVDAEQLGIPRGDAMQAHTGGWANMCGASILSGAKRVSLWYCCHAKIPSGGTSGSGAACAGCSVSGGNAAARAGSHQPAPDASSQYLGEGSLGMRNCQALPTVQDDHCLFAKGRVWRGRRRNWSKDLHAVQMQLSSYRDDRPGLDGAHP
jgi:hypothetical protein